MSPTSRTLALLRRWNFLADVVERWIPRIDRRRDCFGAFDILAINPAGKETWLIQCTSTPNLSSRIKKLCGLPIMGKLLAAGIVLEAWGWSKRGDRWTVKRVRIQGAELEPVEATPRHCRGRRPIQSSLFDDER